MSQDQLAIHGGTPAKLHPDPPMYPGGMAIDHEEEAAVLEVLRSKHLYRYNGPFKTASKVAQLEKAFAEHKGVKYAQAVNSGTSALIAGLAALGVGPGDEVIVPAYTWIASAAAILTVGAVPVMAEVDESLLLDPQDVEQKITPYTKAIMPVHMRGAPCRMDELLAVAHKHNLKVIEDTAQANGASYKGQACGTLGDVGCYSLQFNKIITAGEGGMVVTNEEEIWQRACMFHDPIGALRYGFAAAELRYGINFRMTEIQGAISLVQLNKLPNLVRDMQERQKMLKSGMADIAKQKGITFRASNDPAGDAAVCAIFFVESPEVAQKVTAALNAENIGAAMLYEPNEIDYHVYAHWTPIIEQRAWAAGGDPWKWAKREIKYWHEMCPRSLALLGRAVHLDCSPLLTNEDVEETIEGLNKVLNVMA